MNLKRRKIEDVNQMDICQTYSVIWCNDKIRVNDKDLVSGKISYYKKNQNYILIEFQGEEYAHIYHLDSSVDYKIEKTGDFLTDRIILLGFWDDSYTYRITKAVDFTTNNYLWESDETFLMTFVLNDFFFFSSNKKNICLNKIENAQTVWHFSLSSKYNYFKEADYQGEPPVEVQAEVIKFLGVYKDELWLVLNSGLLALDIKTGKETRYIKEGKMAFGEPFFEDFKGYFGYDTVLDEEKGIIFNLNLHFYIEYDLNSNKNYFDSYSFKESSQKNGLVLNYIGGYDAENIYAYEGSKNNRFAIFSRDKKEIIWSGEILEAKDKFPAIRDLQYGAGKLYVLDHYNTLHIFEEEEIDRN